jgi:methyltransferase (TIGR00027 family)
MLMRKGQRSRTAEFVALNRALGNLAPQVPGFSDPAAVRFLPEKWRRRVEHARVLLETGARQSPYAWWQRGMGVFNQFRTVVLDRAIAGAGPADQLVILGAGLDSRAWRMACLGNTVVFEVDHPASQTAKRERCASVPVQAKDVRFVAMDFESDALRPRLESGGFDASKSTFWLWEGVTMYLRAEDVSANLKVMAELSAPGSRIALTYLRKRHGRIPRGLFLALMGEPIRSAFESAEVTELAGSYGWRLASDTTVNDWLKETPGLKLTRRKVGLQWLEAIWIGAIGDRS